MIVSVGFALVCPILDIQIAAPVQTGHVAVRAFPSMKSSPGPLLKAHVAEQVEADGLRSAARAVAKRRRHSSS